ncbi:transposase [Aquibacillus koreensis]|uniref:Transposase n=1 Tax=Aquibacillus koreensis TaxID=279446 RepID=A0A9X4AIX4_9BACI|nr:transposase [Aquibacillus koreensis]MCT2537157.1 transposase [Aquibacillus koreensis]MDC3419860.1 transposase [Aquibacillus koreensis]
MARKKRIWIPDYFYHVVCRGNHREALFKEEEDFETFLYILEQVNKRHPFELAAFCLMTNHFHLQIRSQKQEISKVMALVNRRYASYFNMKYFLSGHLFEKRYYDKIIPNEQGMLEVSRYIHLNPLEAGMVKRPEDYRWSSFRSYQGNTTPDYRFLRQAILLDYFSGSRLEKRRKYGEFVRGG